MPGDEFKTTKSADGRTVFIFNHTPIAETKGHSLHNDLLKSWISESAPGSSFRESMMRSDKMFADVHALKLRYFRVDTKLERRNEIAS